MKFLILLAQALDQFRVAELRALAEYNGLSVDFSRYEDNTPFLVVDLESIADAKKLVQRSILVKAVYELYGVAETLDKLHEAIKASYSSEYWTQYRDVSFKFEVTSYQGSRPRKEQIAMIETFSYMDFRGPIQMKDPQELFVLIEEFELDTSIAGNSVAQTPVRLWFGRYITTANRAAREVLDLKKRPYIGTTSFEAELALVSCNIVQAGPNKILYDPFAGTGSFLVAGSYFGALTIGSDLDGRTLRGSSPQKSIAGNMKHYGLSKSFIDVMTMDFMHNALRPGLKIDCIVCDPPYGIREGVKTLGFRDPQKYDQKGKVMIDGVPAFARKDFFHPRKPYQFSSLLQDLLEFGSEHMPPGGRLCVWMPTANDSDEAVEVPLHENLKVIANCVQEFNKWSRRMVAYERRPYGETGEKYIPPPEEEAFRAKYFRGFR